MRRSDVRLWIDARWPATVFYMAASGVSGVQVDVALDRDRRLNRAWKVIALADAGVVVYGVMALLGPSVLTAGYESRAGRTWNSLVDADGATADFILLAFRLLGALNVAIGLVLVLTATQGLRRGERWSWWALLVGNLLAYGAPMAYDQAVGEIGVFEMLEYVALAAVLAALAWTAPVLRPWRRHLVP